MPGIQPEDLAGPEEGCPEQFEVCLRQEIAARLARYHDQLRRAAEINKRECAPAAEVKSP